MLRCLTIALLLLICAGFSLAQGVKVEYFATDAEKPIDTKSPALLQVILDLGMVPDEKAEPPTVLKDVLAQTREKATKPLAFAVRVTNGTGAPIPLTYDTLKLATGAWKDMDADFAKAKFLKASAITEYAGAKSVFAKGKELAAGATASGVVYYELDDAQQQGAEPPRRPQYVAGEGQSPVASESKSVAGLLQDLGLEWTTAPTVAPSGDKPKIFPAAGNADDTTPLRLGAPGAFQAAPAKAVIASKNIVGEQTQAAAAGTSGATGMPGGMGMPGGGKGGGQGMPGMGGGAAPGGMPGAAGAPAAMPGMGGGAKPAATGGGVPRSTTGKGGAVKPATGAPPAPGMPGMPGVAAPAAGGAAPATGGTAGRKPKKPAP